MGWLLPQGKKGIFRRTSTEQLISADLQKSSNRKKIDRSVCQKISWLVFCTPPKKARALALELLGQEKKKKKKKLRSQASFVAADAAGARPRGCFCEESASHPLDHPPRPCLLAGRKDGGRRGRRKKKRVKKQSGRKLGEVVKKKNPAAFAPMIARDFPERLKERGEKKEKKKKGILTANCYCD